MTAPVPRQDGERLVTDRLITRARIVYHAAAETGASWDSAWQAALAAVAPDIAADAARVARQQCAIDLWRKIKELPLPAAAALALDDLAVGWSAPASDEETP